jgi:hypothetical protein
LLSIIKNIKKTSPLAPLLSKERGWGEVKKLHLIVNKFYTKVLVGVLFFSTATNAQTTNKNHSLQNVNCKTCHTCDVPTKQNPCLVECPREEMITVHQTAEEGPDLVKIDILTNKYLPVNFSHKTHAQMSEMSGGCANCHHYNTAGPILACTDCHSVERKREDISKPDLQAAYHRQCIDCHKEWSHSTDCNSCHLSKGSNLVQKDLSSVVSAKENHPKVNKPEKLVYETNYNKGRIVTFFHNEHTNIFGAECVSCHKNDNCTRCHDTKNVQTVSSNLPEKITKPASQHHQPCFKCHANDECTKCHLDKPAKPFNHKMSTGWALNRFHEKLECAKCHGSANKFTKLDNNCVSCHKNFAAGSFNHEKTGLKLDEMHVEFDCADCHIENFSDKPDCTNCHDDKSYPKNIPGSLVKVTKKQ